LIVCKMPVVVHRQRCNSVALADAEPLQRLGHPPGLARHLAPACPSDGAVGPIGDDLATAMLALGMVHQPHRPERPVLHRAQLHHFALLLPGKSAYESGLVQHPVMPAKAGIQPEVVPRSEASSGPQAFAGVTFPVRTASGSPAA
jgi:hypothetical protein